MARNPDIPFPKKEYLIDICIPTLNEEKYIYNTLDFLSQQTLYRQGKVNIIIGDYPSEGTAKTQLIVNQFKDARLVPIHKRGIGYARNVTIRSGVAPLVVNFDADCHYNRNDALELMAKPLLATESSGAPQALMTNCDIELDTAGKKAQDTNNFADKLITISSLFYRMAPITMGPCMMFSREAFEMVGGFRELPQNIPGEDWEFVFRFCQNFSIRAKQWVKDVVVIASPRRHKNLLLDPFALDYSRQYR